MMQPSSGGCVLKRRVITRSGQRCRQPSSGGCVLKQVITGVPKIDKSQPSSGGCVLKQIRQDYYQKSPKSSRLRAAVC